MTRIRNEEQKRKHREQMQAYRDKDREKYNKYMRELKEIYRMKVVVKLGSKCLHCGFSDSRALQIDHVNGGGKQEMKTINRLAFYKRVFEDVYGKYQLLCANCNWIKRSGSPKENSRGWNSQKI